ncbi:MAG: hypothetical protein FWG80_00940 [Alphaproteobacteria bacterium]|nr:hypothetical protein [Alphaproteobacteria bacterium]
MKKTLFIIHYSLFIALTASSPHAAVRITSGTQQSNPRAYYAEGYNQITQMQAEAAYYASPEGIEAEIAALPVRVVDPDVARAIVMGYRTPGAVAPGNMPVAIEALQRCAAINPQGKFAWTAPNAGLRIGDNTPRCVAEVGMWLQHGNNDILLAHAFVAAGDSVDCNISHFPESGYTIDAGKVTFPADKAPTKEDVKKIMDQEQKQNAGLKTAAAALVGGAGMFFLNRSNPGTETKDNLGAAVKGAIGAGGVTYASTQMGHVGGNTLMGAGVNAVGGAFMGNMSGIGKSKLMIRDCETEATDDAEAVGAKSNQQCLWGTILSAGEKISKKCDQSDCLAYLTLSRDTIVTCTRQEFSHSNCPDKYICTAIRATGWKIKNPDKDLSTGGCGTKEDWTDWESLASAFTKPENRNKGCKFWDENKHIKLDRDGCKGEGDGYETYIPIDDGFFVTREEPAVLILPDDATKGLKAPDASTWSEKKSGWLKGTIAYRRGTKIRSLFVASDGVNNSSFSPLYDSADDGRLVDFQNQARTTATVTGGVAGGALGGLSAYHGAQDEIDVRYAAAEREYKDSLQKIYCKTGNRFLSGYNDIVVIPAIVE